MSGLTREDASFLEGVKIPLKLGALTQSGWPVIVSLWFVWREGSLWCATQRSAKIADHLMRDSRCAFEVAPDQPPYRGIRGRATARLHPQRGEEILRVLLDKYLGGTDSPLAKRLLAKTETEVAIEVSPVSIHTWDYRERMKHSIEG
ncbi:MAG TPA: hypothetical protein VIW01_02275 [Dehalococcoidia bacterium]